MRQNSGILAQQGGVCLPSKEAREGKWFVVKGGKSKDRAIVFNTARARKMFLMMKSRMLLKHPGKMRMTCMMICLCQTKGMAHR